MKGNDMSQIWLHKGTVFTGVALLPDTTVVLEDGKIKEVLSEYRVKQKGIPKDAIVYEADGAYISPGFIDTHIHGLHGYDTSDGTLEAVLEMSKALVKYGVTGFCPTMYPQADEAFDRCIRNVVEAIPIAEGAKIYGLHLEGPFVSRDKTGVLNPQYMKAVDLDLMKHYCEISECNIAIMTVAPELKNMHDLALFCTQQGIVLSAGHSNATYENMLEGIQAGILHSTHFFNAMRRLHHRDPGVVGAIMIHPNVSAEIIGDGHHLHPSIIKLLMRVKPIHKIVLVTDALKPTMQQEGVMIANNEEVYVEDGVFHRKGDGTIAGSSLTMIRGVQTLVEIGVPVDDALRMASCNPAMVISKHIETGYLLPGRKGDVVMFSKDYQVKLTIVDGTVKYQS
jgi:N-acetylglucosamine-6-phosphate deacetylase